MPNFELWAGKLKKKNTLNPKGHIWRPADVGVISLGHFLCLVGALLRIPQCWFPQKLTDVRKPPTCVTGLSLLGHVVTVCRAVLGLTRCRSPNLRTQHGVTRGTSVGRSTPSSLLSLTWLNIIVLSICYLTSAKE